MAKKLIQYPRPIQSAYYYDGRSTQKSRKPDYKGHALTPHGAKKAAYRNLDPDYGPARRVIITDLRTGLELWHMHTTADGNIMVKQVSAKTQQIVEADIKVMAKLGKKF